MNPSPNAPTTAREVAEWLHKILNLNVIPQKMGERASVLPSWTERRDKRLSLDELQKLFARPNTMPAIILDRTSRVVMLDSDEPGSEAALEEYALPPTLTVRSRRGLHRFYRLPGGMDYPSSSGFYLVERDGAKVEVKANVLTSMPPQRHPADPSFRLSFEPDAPLSIALAPPSIQRAVQESMTRRAQMRAENTGVAGNWGNLLESVIDAGLLDSHMEFTGGWRSDGTRPVKCPFAAEHSGGERDESSAYFVTRDAAGLRCHEASHNLMVLPLLERVGFANTKSAVRKKLKAAGLVLPDKLDAIDKPKICTHDVGIEEMTRQAIEAIREGDDPPTLFTKTGLLVRLERETANGKPTHVVTKEMTVPRVVNALGKHAYWYTFDKNRVPIETLPVQEVAKNILSMPAEERPFPPLTNITRVPILRTDGSIIDTPGYDEVTGVYYEPESELVIPPVPARPTKEELAAALGLYRELFADFPFEGPSSFAHAMSLTLLPFMRQTFQQPGAKVPCTPMHTFEASMPKSGKSLLLDMCMLPAFGVEIAKKSYINDDEPEMAKALVASILDSSPYIVFDNVKGNISSPALELILTTSWFKNRILGGNANVVGEVNFVWAMTANNPKYSRDMTTRCLLIRLEPREERPELRDNFRHPHLSRWAANQRGALVHAALTICRAWVAAGMPKSTTAVMGNYSEWAEAMGGLLDAVGVEGFLGNRRMLLADEDGDYDGWAAFFAEWYAAKRDKEVKTIEVLNYARSHGVYAPKDTFMPDSSQAKALTAVLEKKRAMVLGDYKLLRVQTANKTAAWKLLYSGTAPVVSEMPEVEALLKTLKPTTF